MHLQTAFNYLCEIQIPTEMTPSIESYWILNCDVGLCLLVLDFIDKGDFLPSSWDCMFCFPSWFPRTLVGFDFNKIYRCDTMLSNFSAPFLNHIGSPPDQLCTVQTLTLSTQWTQAVLCKKYLTHFPPITPAGKWGDKNRIILNDVQT